MTCSAVRAVAAIPWMVANAMITEPPSQLPIRMLPPNTGVEFRFNEIAPAARARESRELPAPQQPQRLILTDAGLPDINNVRLRSNPWWISILQGVLT